jgi:hypothetical protein
VRCTVIGDGVSELSLTEKRSGEEEGDTFFLLLVLSGSTFDSTRNERCIFPELP